MPIPMITGVTFMGSQPLKCEICGAEARVHVTNDLAAPGELSHYCLKCADADDQLSALGRKSRNRSAVVMTLGAFVLAISVFADWLHLGPSQRAGMAHALILAGCVMLVGAGALMRAAAILIVGIAMLILTLLADQLALGDMPGFGMQQVAGAILGILTIVGGFFAFRKARRPSGHRAFVARRRTSGNP